MTPGFDLTTAPTQQISLYTSPFRGGGTSTFHLRRREFFTVRWLWMIIILRFFLLFLLCNAVWFTQLPNAVAPRIWIIRPAIIAINAHAFSISRIGFSAVTNWLWFHDKRLFKELWSEFLSTVHPQQNDSAEKTCVPRRVCNTNTEWPVIFEHLVSASISLEFLSSHNSAALQHDLIHPSHRFSPTVCLQMNCGRRVAHLFWARLSRFSERQLNDVSLLLHCPRKRFKHKRSNFKHEIVTKRTF